MELGKSTIAPNARCIACGARVSVITASEGDHTPREHDITVCLCCGTPMAFTADMALRALEDGELDSHPDTVKHQVLAICAGYPPLTERQLRVGKALRGGISPFDIRNVFGLTGEEETVLQRMFFIFNVMREYGYPSESIHTTLLKRDGGGLNAGMAIVLPEHRLGVIPAGAWGSGIPRYNEMWEFFQDVLEDLPPSHLAAWMLGGGRFKISSFLSTMRAAGISYGPEWKGSSELFPELAESAIDPLSEALGLIVPDMSKVH